MKLSFIGCLLTWLAWFPIASGSGFASEQTNTETDAKLQLSLPQAIQLGLKKHPLIEAAHGNIESARGQFWKSIAPDYPAITIEREQIPHRMGWGDFEQEQRRISQPFEFPLLTFLKGRAGSIGIGQAQVALSVARAEARRQITLAYVSTWVAEQRVLVAESLASIATGLVKMAERRAEVGEITALDVDRLRVQAGTFARELEQTKLDASVARSWLAILTGLKATSIILLNAGEVEVPPGEVWMVEEPNFFLESDFPIDSAALVQEARLAVKQAQTERLVNQLAWLPRIELAYFSQRIANEKFWGANIGLSLPLWFPFRGRGELLTGKGAVQRTVSQAEQIRRNWLNDWIIISRGLEVDARKLGIFREVDLPAARRATTGAVRSYQLGEINLTDLRETLLSTQSTQLEYLQALMSFWNKKTRLDVLTARHRP